MSCSILSFPMSKAASTCIPLKRLGDQENKNRCRHGVVLNEKDQINPKCSIRMLVINQRLLLI